MNKGIEKDKNTQNNEKFTYHHSFYVFHHSIVLLFDLELFQPQQDYMKKRTKMLRNNFTKKNADASALCSQMKNSNNSYIILFHSYLLCLCLVLYYYIIYLVGINNVPVFIFNCVQILEVQKSTLVYLVFTIQHCFAFTYSSVHLFMPSHSLVRAPIEK